MSTNEVYLRDMIDKMRETYPHHGHEAVRALDDMLIELRVNAMDDAMAFFTKKQKELDRQRTAAKSLSNAEIADLKTEAGRCGWAAQQIRMEHGRRKKGKGKTG